MSGIEAAQFSISMYVNRCDPEFRISPLICSAQNHFLCAIDTTSQPPKYSWIPYQAWASRVVF